MKGSRGEMASQVSTRSWGGRQAGGRRAQRKVRGRRLMVDGRWLVDVEKIQSSAVVSCWDWKGSCHAVTVTHGMTGDRRHPEQARDRATKHPTKAAGGTLI